MSEADHLRTGRWAEDQALAHLQSQGLSPLARNFRCRLGELDLIMSDGAALVFVEVRYRSGGQYGGALESVTAAKQRRLRAAAHAYLARLGNASPPCRFDVVSVTKRNYRPDILWVKDAF